MNFLHELAKYRGAMYLTVPRELQPIISKELEKFGRVARFRDVARIINGKEWNDVEVYIPAVDENTLSIDVERWAMEERDRRHEC